MERSIKSRAIFFERINKIDKTRFTEKNRTQINQIGNERGEITKILKKSSENTTNSYMATNWTTQEK